jgi:type III pantothenate kinase
MTDGQVSVVAIDIGNSNVQIGIGPLDLPEWSLLVRLTTAPTREVDDWHALLAPHLTRLAREIDSPAVVGCSVVPSLTPKFRDLVERLWKAPLRLVTWQSRLAITVATDRPAETGADRIVNADAAYREFGGPVLVVDAGTATKIDAVTEDGRFIGGAIAPGLGASLEALTSRAAQLSNVPLEVPRAAAGSNTVTAMQAGVVLGHAAMVDGLVDQMRVELGEPRAIVLTGGFSRTLRECLQSPTVIRSTHTLDGLRALAATQ